MLNDGNGCELKLIVFVLFYLLYPMCTRPDSASLEDSAVITGEVKGDSAFVVLSPKVFAIDYSTDRVYSAWVNRAGCFTLNNLPSGTYTLYAQASYFANDTISNVVIESPDTVSLTFHLSCKNSRVPYPPHTYTHADTVLVSSLILNRYIDSETKNINSSNRWAILLNQDSLQSQEGKIQYARCGRLISDVFTFCDYPLEANMSWDTYTTPSNTSAADNDFSVEFRVRSIGIDDQVGPWSRPFTSPMNIKPFLDDESKRFQYEMVLKTDNPSVSPVVTFRRIVYSYNANVRLADGEMQAPIF